EGELRTAIKNDTLLVRPYAGTIFNRLDGSQRSLGPDPGGGEAWSQVTTGPGCSVAAPCYQAISFLAAIKQQELDRLHGTTVTLIHPMGEGVLHLGYDYRSDETSFYSGNPSYAYDNTGPSILAYQARIPTTLARNFDWSASATIPVTSRLKLAVGGYYTTWKLDYGILNSVFNVATNLVTRSTSTATRSYAHSDPHLGLTWRPTNDTTYRVTAGSSITVPYANQVSGGDTYTAILTPVGVIGMPNPNLKPETTVAYDLGLDHRFGNGTILVADLFDNTIHNVFVNDVYPWVPSQNGLPDTPLNQLLFASVTTPGNAALQRNYGVELSLARQPASGLGYRVATTFQRAFLDQLPASFFGVRSALINGKQLDGSTSIPYARAYGELGYRNPSGLGATFGADYTSSNNWTNGPAFTLFSSTLRYDMRGGRRFQLTVSNLFNMTNGQPYDVTAAGNGFATVTYGSAKAGAAPTFGSLTTPRYGLEPRTLRLQYEMHPNH
ncbi:MAG: TonB-dependent receptor, partial [Candidatus Eremiobacteraeota bacterium]|nr:TonB-dependent receptor [Candidatus Eremiobacteraeota bacterium]